MSLDLMQKNYMSKSWPKWANALFVQKNQRFAHFPKLIKKMPLFWNSIFSKSSFNLKLDFLKIEFQFKTRFLDNRVITNWKLNLKQKKGHGTWVPCKYIYIYIFFFKVWPPHTRFSTNRVLHWNSILRKSSFKTGAFT